MVPYNYKKKQIRANINKSRHFNMVSDCFLRFIQKALNLSNDVKNSRNLGSEMASLDMIVYGKHTELSRVLLIKLTLIF